ncbi:MAG: hypothetical protein WD426_06285 [Anditalea sp.]
MFSVAIIVLISVLIYLILILKPLIILWYEKNYHEELKYSFKKDLLSALIWKSAISSEKPDFERRIHGYTYLLTGLLILALLAEAYILFFKSDFNQSPDPGIQRGICLIKDNLDEINSKLIFMHSHDDSSETAQISKSINILISDHNEINDRLRDLEETINHHISSSGPTRLSLIQTFSYVLIVIGIASLIYFLGDKHKWIARFSISSLLGGVALLGIETFNGEFKFFEKTIFNNTNDAGETKELTYTQFALDSIGSVTKFKEGTSDQDYDTKQFKEIAKNIKNRSDIAGLLVIGEVDKRELKDGVKKQFGSNLSLARARAEYIKTRLSKIVLPKNIPMITFGRGAYHTSLNDKKSDQDQDRQVVVYAITNNIKKIKTPLAEEVE